MKRVEKESLDDQILLEADSRKKRLKKLGQIRKIPLTERIGIVLFVKL